MKTPEEWLRGFWDGSENTADKAIKLRLVTVGVEEIGAIQADASKMSWTTDKPTEAGWYWVDDGENDPYILAIFQGETGLEADGEFFYWPIEDCNDAPYKWSGPIPHPT